VLYTLSNMDRQFHRFYSVPKKSTILNINCVRHKISVWVNANFSETLVKNPVFKCSVQDPLVWKHYKDGHLFFLWQMGVTPNACDDLFLKSHEKMMITSPPTIGVPPIILLICAISLLGPARREVPVSAIAWQPPSQNVLPLTDTL